MNKKLKKPFRIVAFDDKLIIVNGEFSPDSTTETLKENAFAYNTEKEKEDKIKKEKFHY